MDNLHLGSRGCLWVKDDVVLAGLGLFDWFVGGRTLRAASEYSLPDVVVDSSSISSFEVDVLTSNGVSVAFWLK